MADLRKKSHLFGEGSKTSCAKFGTNKDLDEMRRRLTERLSGQTSEAGQSEENLQGQWERRYRSETHDTLPTMKLGDEEHSSQGQARLEADSIIGQIFEADDADERARRKKKMEYNRLSPFQRRQRKQQELNEALLKFRSDVEQVARTKHNPY